MRDKVYSEKHRKIYRLVNQVLKNSLITKLIHKNQKDDSLEIDTLTGVYNQFAINQFLKELHPQEGKQYGIILFNIDNLNKIKEQYQSEAMNEVLSNVAERLTHNIRETDLVGRLSCSEFILILHDINQKQVTQIAERLLKVMKSNPIKFKSKTIPVQFSYGTSVSGQNTTKSEEVLEQADQNRFIGKGQPHSFYAESQILS